MIIDLTIIAPRLASRIGDWCVLEVITFSDHRCVEFSIQQRSHTVNVGRGGKVRSPSWNTKRLSKDKLLEHLEDTRLIDELGWAGSARRWRTLCGRRGGKWSQHVTAPCLVVGKGVPGTRFTGGMTSCLSCIENALQRRGNLPAQRVTFCCARHKKNKISSEARHKEKPTSVLERLDQ